MRPLLAYCKDENWGDRLSPILFEHLSGIKPQSFDRPPAGSTTYMFIGSILDEADETTVVWGAGFISADSVVRAHPRKICAVRGPLTRQLLTAQGIGSPAVFGDPALLYPLFYQPNVQKTHRLGIVPHYVDADNPWLETMAKEPGVKLIDIRAPINHVVDEICRCEHIASSSLHGIICADAYDIPSVWLVMSDKVIGDGFKFRDYFAFQGRYLMRPLTVRPQTTLGWVMRRMRDPLHMSLEPLIAACPLKVVGSHERLT